MSESVIREFLVTLGVRSDEAALKKFEKGIADATKAVTALALAVEASAIAVGVGVARFAASLETLYFAANRTNSTATNFKAFTRAAQDFGVSAGEAAGSIEGLQRFLRNNPAGGGYLDTLLHQVGRSAYDATGHINDTTENLAYLGELFKRNTDQGNGFLNAQYAGMLGIDEKTMLAIQNGDFEKNLARIQKRLGRAGYKDATEGAHQFMQDLRDLGDQLEIFGVRVQTVLEKKLGISVKSITHWFEQNGDHLADQVADLVKQFIEDFNKILAWLQTHGPEIAQAISDALGQVDTTYKFIKPAMEWLWQKFKDLNDETDGWALKVGVLVVALKAMGATSIIGGILSLSAAFVRLGAAMVSATAAATVGGGAALAGGAAAGTGLLAWLTPAGLAGLGTVGGAIGATGAVGAGLGVGYLINQLFPDGPLARLGNRIGDWVHDLNNPGDHAYRFLKELGATPEQAAGLTKVFAVESGLHPNAVGDDGHAYGLGQWHEDRQADFERQFGYPMQMSTMEDQLKFAMTENDPGARAAINATRAMRNQPDIIDAYVRMAERPANPNAEIAKANRIEIDQDVTIHVDGSQSPMTTAQAIKDEIKRSNVEMFRNLKAPVQ